MGMQYSRGLVAGYPFENMGADILGNNNATILGATYAAGKVGNCIVFDGVDDYGTIVATGLKNQTFTVSCWINLKTATVGCALALGTATGIKGVFIASCTGGNIRFGAYIDGLFRIIALPQTAFINAWNYLALTYNGSALILYVNGLFNSQIAISGTVAYEPNSHIGRISGNYYNGKVDLLKIYSKALTQSEIQRDYLNLPIF